MRHNSVGIHVQQKKILGDRTGQFPKLGSSFNVFKLQCFMKLREYPTPFLGSVKFCVYSFVSEGYKSV